MSSQPSQPHNINDQLKWLTPAKAALSKDAVVVPQPDRNGEFACPADGAKFMASFGIPQTPLRGKKPDIGGANWHLRASTDFAQIDEWARIHPGCNFGSVAFAEIGKHFVLEADSPEVRKRHKADTNTDFPKTLTIQSQEGRGHRWYLQTAESIALGNISQDNRFGDFSLRMQHEQAVSPGSIHPDTHKQYRVAANTSPVELLHPDIKWLGTQKRFRTKIDRSLTGKKIPHGEHDITLFKIACSLRHDGLEEQGITACLIEVCEKRCEGFGDDYLEMCAKCAASACKYPPGTDKAVIFKESAYGVPPAEVEAPSNTNAPALEFRFPKVEGGAFDFVCEPFSGQTDGWFPLGSPSLIAGSSGANKSTLMLQLLQAQRYKEPFLGHETKGRSYLIIMCDRDAESHERTMTRMRLTDQVIPIKYMETIRIGIEGVQEIVRTIEDTIPMPQVVLIEGADMLVEDANKKRVVTEFMGLIRQVARQYHIAIVMSVGSPKAKAGEGYIGKRDNVSGSEAWSRMSETVMLLQYPKGKDTSLIRELTVLPRNAKAESFTLVMERGRLRVQTDADREKQLLADDPALTWVREQARLAETDPAKKWWTVLQLRRATKMKRTAVREWVNEAYDNGWIIKKAGTGNKGRGKAALYSWNPSDTTNSWFANHDSENDILNVAETFDSENDTSIEFGEKSEN